MTKALAIVIPVVFLGAAAGCGPDAELVASGKAHACAIADLEEQLASNPGDEGIQQQLEDKRALLDTVIETADEGGRADLSAAIDEAVVEGCD